MANSAFEGIGITEWQINPLDINPDIDENLAQTIAYLSAFNDPNKVFKVIRADSDGRLLVSTSATKLANYNRKSVTVLTTATLVFAANTNRRYYTIYNVSHRILYLGSEDTLTVAQGIALVPGAYFTDDSHIGAVYMRSAAGNGLIYASEY